MDSRDMYLRYFTDDKPHCDAETNILSSETEGSLEPIETMFADISDGNLAWTIDGYSILMNPEQTKDMITTNTKTTINTEVPLNAVTLSNEPLLVQLNMELPNEVLINDNKGIEMNNDPIFNGSDDIMVQQDSFRQSSNSNPNILNCRSLLKSSVVETVKIADMIEEITAFNCKKCGKLYRLRNEMIDHIKTLHLPQRRLKTDEITSNSFTKTKEDSTHEVVESVIYLCGICGKIGYNSQEVLRQHMISVHEVESENNFESIAPVISDKNSKNKAEDQTHSTNVLKDYQLFVQNHQKSMSKLRCSVKYCESRFASDELRLLHEKCHSDYPFSNNKSENVITVKSLQDYRYKCTECDTRFVLWKSCSSHLWTRHKIDIGLYNCPMCIKFKSISPHLVFKHLSTAHLSSNHPTTTTKACLCTMCGARYKSLGQLRIHMERIHHSPSIPFHTCVTCQRRFATMQSLRKHIDQMHVRSKMFSCSICGYQTTRKDSMDKHARAHTGEKPYECGICEFRTGDKSTMKRHEMRHVGATSYSCPHCPYTSIQSVAYKKHLNNNHPAEGGLYTCHICETQYIREASFQAHMRDHRLGLVQSPPTLEDVEEVNPPAALGIEESTLVSILRCQTMSDNS